MTILQARPREVEIDLGRTAVVVVDMQNAYAKKGGMLDLVSGSGFDEARVKPVIEANARLLPVARAAGVKVVYLQFGYRPGLGNAGGTMSPNRMRHMAVKMISERPEVGDKLIVEDTWGWRIIDELTPEAGDIVVKKSRFSGFAGTDLENILLWMDVRHLLFTGVATNVCVDSTAREAYFREFWPILVEDAMDHTGPDFTRQATIWNFETKFGWVTDTAAVMDMLERSQGYPARVLPHWVRPAVLHRSHPARWASGPFDLFVGHRNQGEQGEADHRGDDLGGQNTRQRERLAAVEDTAQPGSDRGEDGGPWNNSEEGADNVG